MEAQAPSPQGATPAPGGATSGAVSPKKKLFALKPHALLFNLKEEEPSAKITVSSQSDTRIAWRIQTTATKHYWVTPCSGFLQPKEKIAVRVWLRSPRHFSDKHRFMLMATEAGDFCKNRKEFWSNPVSFNLLQCVRILPTSADNTDNAETTVSMKLDTKRKGSQETLEEMMSGMGEAADNSEKSQKDEKRKEEEKLEGPALIERVKEAISEKESVYKNMFEVVNRAKQLEIDLDKTKQALKKAQVEYARLVQEINAMKTKLIAYNEGERMKQQK